MSFLVEQGMSGVKAVQHREDTGKYRRKNEFRALRLNAFELDNWKVRAGEIYLFQNHGPFELRFTPGARIIY